MKENSKDEKYADVNYGFRLCESADYAYIFENELFFASNHWHKNRRHWDSMCFILLQKR